MKPIYFAMGASFLLGIAGYVIIMFWVRPIVGYLKIKRRIAVSLRSFRSIQMTGASDETARKWLSDHAAKHRRYAGALQVSFTEELPYWYIILLKSRRHAPPEAAKQLMALSNTHDIQHAGRQIEKIEQALF
jgi:hypothetical protein